MLHGKTKEIKLVDIGGEGRVTGFKIGTIRGDGKIEVSQTPAGNKTGWSTLPGAIQVKSLAVDGPSRVVPYYIEILLGGRQGARIAGGNIWCQVNVIHVAPPTPTFTPTLTPSDTPTPTPPVKESLVTCRFEMKHGEMKDFTFESPRNILAFDISQVIGDGQIGVAALNDGEIRDGKGIVRVISYAVDGPTRTEKYLIKGVFAGSEGPAVVDWCLVLVHHIAPTPTPTPTVKPTPTFTPTPKYIITGGASIITDDGFKVTYPGPFEVPTGRTLRVPVRFQFQVLTPAGLPAKGELTVTLRASASDPDAVHATAELDAQGEVTIPLDINWPAGTILELLFSHEGKVYKLANLTVTP